MPPANKDMKKNMIIRNGVKNFKVTLSKPLAVIVLEKSLNTLTEPSTECRVSPFPCPASH